MGKGAVAGNSNLFIGTAALSENDYVHAAIGRADLIVAIGHDTVEKPPFIMRDGGPEVVHVDFNSADIDQIYFPRIEVIGDIADSMGRIAAQLDGKLSHDPSYFMKIRETILAHTPRALTIRDFLVGSATNRRRCQTGDAGRRHYLS